MMQARLPRIRQGLPDRHRRVLLAVKQFTLNNAISLFVRAEWLVPRR